MTKRQRQELDIVNLAVEVIELAVEAWKYSKYERPVTAMIDGKAYEIIDASKTIDVDAAKIIAETLYDGKSLCCDMMVGRPYRDITADERRNGKFTIGRVYSIYINDLE